jgi:hypothetical protein
MDRYRTFAVFIRLMAAAMLAIGVAAVIPTRDNALQVPQTGAWAALLVSLGLCVVLLAMAELLARRPPVQQDLTSAIGRMQQQLAELHLKLDDLRAAHDSAEKARVDASAAPAPPPVDYGPQFQQLATALAEVRQISLLSDADRKQFTQLHHRQRKTSMLKELFALIAAQDWARAERLLITTEREFPNDEEVRKVRSYLDHSRRLREEETLVRTAREVEELVQAHDYPTALDRTRRLVEGFPYSSDARTLHQRVEHEYEVYLESDAQRMFDDIRQHIERRSWRRALAHAMRLIEICPNHRLAVQIRPQLQTLRDNAEIEQRQEMEAQIQELIRAGRLHDAIVLGEDLLRRYPASPQAESLEVMLPRLRELARSGVEEFAALSSVSPKSSQAVTREDE